MQDVTVIFRRRGGDDLEQNHSQWERTIKASPDIIGMTFFPITALLENLPGKKHLIRAITLYLECKWIKLYTCAAACYGFLYHHFIFILPSDKPPIEELKYFLEFQIPQIWAPVHERIPGQQRKEPVCPSLQFSLMGQKFYVSQEQVWFFFSFSLLQMQKSYVP